jgi:hypothetical protein
MPVVSLWTRIPVVAVHEERAVVRVQASPVVHAVAPPKH